MNGIPLADWQDEMLKRGGLDCKFVCPVCGNVASPNDWRAEAPEIQDPDRAAVQCIGRIRPRAECRRAFPHEEEPDAPERPCDYAAFGLFNLCNVRVEFPDGRSIGVFEFAEDTPDNETGVAP